MSGKDKTEQNSVNECISIVHKITITVRLVQLYNELHVEDEFQAHIWFNIHYALWEQALSSNKPRNSVIHH